MKTFLILICVLSFSNSFCQKTEDPNIERILKGNWVKNTQTKDTLKFISKNTFNLITGKGSTHKKAGMYDYSTMDGKMTINWGASSTRFPKGPFYEFHFEKNNSVLKIKNFYKADGEYDWLAFEKIK